MGSRSITWGVAVCTGLALWAGCSGGGKNPPSQPNPPGTFSIQELVPARTTTADSVQVVGTGFGASQGNSEVLFTFGGGSTAARLLSPWSDTALLVEVPPAPQGGEWTAVKVRKGGVDSNARPFSVSLPVGYENDLRPIFQVNGCFGCHGVGAINANLDVTSYESLLLGDSAHGPVVIRRRSGQSLLVAKISLNTPPVGSRMPQGGPPMSVAEIQKVSDWVDQGAWRR